MKVDITGVHYQVSGRLESYIQKKIGSLERFVKREVRESAVANVKLKEIKASDKNEFECYVSMHLPRGLFEARERTTSMFAAVDMVESKLKTQLKKRKDTKDSPKFYQKLANRLRRKSLS